MLTRFWIAPSAYVSTDFFGFGIQDDEETDGPPERPASDSYEMKLAELSHDTELSQVRTDYDEVLMQMQKLEEIHEQDKSRCAVWTQRRVPSRSAAVRRFREAERELDVRRATCVELEAQVARVAEMEARCYELQVAEARCIELEPLASRTSAAEAKCRELELALEVDACSAIHL